MVEPSGEHLAVDVPFTTVIAAVAGGFEKIREKPRSLLTDAAISAKDVWQCVAVNLLWIIAGQQRRARGPAAGSVLEIREAQAMVRESVEIWRSDLTTVAADVRKTEIVSKNEDDVRLGCICGGETTGHHRGEE
jgi:hypothetical protein